MVKIEYSLFSCELEVSQWHGYIKPSYTDTHYLTTLSNLHEIALYDVLVF